MALIEFKDFSFKYALCSSPAVKNIDLSINDGEFVLLCGQNGSGKSTMVKVLAEVFHRIRTKDILILLLECIPFHIYIIICKLQCILDIVLVRAIEYRCGNVKAECLCSKA